MLVQNDISMTVRTSAALVFILLFGIHMPVRTYINRQRENESLNLIQSLIEYRIVLVNFKVFK